MARPDQLLSRYRGLHATLAGLEHRIYVTPLSDGDIKDLIEAMDILALRLTATRDYLAGYGERPACFGRIGEPELTYQVVEHGFTS